MLPGSKRVPLKEPDFFSCQVNCMKYSLILAYFDLQAILVTKR